MCKIGKMMLVLIGLVVLGVGVGDGRDRVTESAIKRQRDSLSALLMHEVPVRPSNDDKAETIRGKLCAELSRNERLSYRALTDGYSDGAGGNILHRMIRRYRRERHSHGASYLLFRDLIRDLINIILDKCNGANSKRILRRGLFEDTDDRGRTVLWLLANPRSTPDVDPDHGWLRGYRDDLDRGTLELILRYGKKAAIRSATKVVNDDRNEELDGLSLLQRIALSTLFKMSVEEFMRSADWSSSADLLDMWQYHCPCFNRSAIYVLDLFSKYMRQETRKAIVDKVLLYEGDFRLPAESIGFISYLKNKKRRRMGLNLSYYLKSNDSLSGHTIDMPSLDIGAASPCS